MAIPLTIGRYKPPSLGNPYTGVGQQYAWGRTATPSYGGPQISGGTGIPMPGGPPGGGYTSQNPKNPVTIDPIQMTPGSAGYWTTPDYSSMIGGSYEVDAAESAMGSQMAAARAAFQRQLRGNLVDLGYAPSASDLGKGGQLGDFSKYIDKTTLQKAIDNKYSAYANIQKQEAQNRTMMEAEMAARGGTTSGTMSASETDLTSQAEQARYEGLRTFLAGGEQGLSGLSTLQAQLAASVAQARAAAASRLASMYPPTWTDPVAPTQIFSNPNYQYPTGGDPPSTSIPWWLLK